MDNELILRQFDEIEEKVEKLLMAFQALEATNGGLQHKIESLNASIAQGIKPVGSGARLINGFLKNSVPNLGGKIDTSV